jgi:hypothetical protein
MLNFLYKGYGFKKLNLILLMLFSSFGWYIFPSFGVRLEHVFIYLFLLFLILNNSVCVKKHRHVLLLLFSLLLLIFIPFIGYALLDKTLESSLVVSQLENYTQPLAIVLISFSVLRNLNYPEVKLYFDFIIKVFVILMALHTLISILMKINPSFEYWRLFTGENAISELSWETSMNAAELAAYGGRSSGIFTQVFEAGYAYSLALIFWAYLKNSNTNFIKYSHIILLLIFIGGLITYSKVFLVLGILFFSLIIKNIFLLRYLLLIPFFIMTALFFDFNLGAFERGLVYIERLIFFPSSYSMFDIYTSGRFSDNSIIILNMKDIVFNSPIFGYGYGSIRSSDFSLYEVISLGGLAGILIYLLLFLHLFYICFSIQNKRIRELCMYTMLITLLTSISAPTITANRVSVIFWIVISLVVALNVIQFNRGSAKRSKTIMTKKEVLP